MRGRTVSVNVTLYERFQIQLLKVSGNNWRGRGECVVMVWKKLKRGSAYVREDGEGMEGECSCLSILCWIEYANIHMHRQTHTERHTRTQTDKHAHTHTHARAHTHICRNTYTQIYTTVSQMTHMHTHFNPWSSRLTFWWFRSR